ncbi:MAG: MBL fold metallo-hydrolase [Planctomycetia bacterium]|nr:MBL fold metallo-hydrolase [Planctomycetia bacterium]
MARITFHGAAETVTGSKYLLEAGDTSVLIDCGLFQGLKELRLRNWAALPFKASTVDACVLTHVHIDHVGYLPKFVQQGFHGPVYGTPVTVELCDLMLYDSAKNQESDAEHANRHGYTKHHPAQALYDEHDVTRTLKLLRRQSLGAWFQAAGPIWCRYHDAGHLLGSAMIEVEIRDQSPPLRILFSGDVGRYNAPLYHDPSPPTACDYLICESTYGNRDHPEEAILDQLCEVVLAGNARGGVLLTASFAVGRAQQFVYLMEILIAQGRIPEMPIYIDSPMAVDATHIFQTYRADHDLAEGKLRGKGSELFGPNVQLARSAEESKRINIEKGPAMIIASSGMMTGGRILHHLKQRLPDPKNTIVLGGFQAIGTRGRQLQEGARSIRIHGRDIPVRANIASASSLSGHAGRSELLRWLADLPAPRQVFLTHGEKASSESFAAALRTTRQWDVVVPRMGQAFEL